MRNMQTSGRPVKDQRSLKSPRKWLISYLILSGKIAATAMDKELNTRQVRMYKIPANRFLLNNNCYVYALAFYYG